MARTFIFAVGAMAVATSAMATVHDSTTGAPPGTSETRYCMRIEAITGSRIEKLRCWTREEWAEKGVDVDVDWAREGVRTIG